jgi:hypothetical protein
MKQHQKSIIWRSAHNKSTTLLFLLLTRPEKKLQGIAAAEELSRSD